MQPVKSLVLELSDEQPAKKKKKISLPIQTALDALKALTVHGEDASETAWRQECYSRGIATTDNPDAKKKAFSRARTFLIENFYIQTRDELYWLCQSREDSGQRDRTGQCGTSPPLSPIGDRDRRDNNLKGCPVVPPMDAFCELEKGQPAEPAFQDFDEGATPNIPEPESAEPITEHTSIPEVEPGDLMDKHYRGLNENGMEVFEI